MTEIAVIGGLLTSLAFTVVVLAVWRLAPEVWIGDVTEGREESPRTAALYGGFALIICIMIAGAVATAWVAAVQSDASFWQRAFIAWSVLLFLNVVDLVLIDIVIYMWIHPRWMRLPDHPPLHSYRAHAVAALKGTAMAVPIALIAALVTIPG